MWLKLLELVIGLAGKLFGIGQSDPAETAHKEGEVSGKAQERARNAEEGVRELERAADARNRADDAIRSDGVRAPDSDMAKRGSDGVS